MNSGLLRLFLFLAISFLSFGEVQAQTGTYFMTHYNPGEQNFDNSNYGLIQDGRGVMHMANRQGVLHYDGNSWWLTPTPFTVFCIVEADNKIFVGGREGFGYITLPAIGDHDFVELDSIHFDISKTIVKNNRVYYSNENHLFSLDINHPQDIDTIITSREELLDLTEFDNKIYVTTASGLKEVKDGVLTAPGLGQPSGTYFIRESPAGQLLFLTDSNDIYVNSHDSITKLAFNNKPYLEDHSLTEIIWVTDSLVAISTFSGGIIFINIPSGTTEHIVDYNAGLPDNQITSIYTDLNGSFWAIHPFGLTVISPELPLRGYNHYPGLKGALVSVASFDEALYVGTSLGVYKLTEVQKVKKSVVYDRVRVRTEDDEEKEEIVKKKKVFGLFKKKNRNDSQSEINDRSKEKYKYVYRKRIVEEEISKSYEYVKVKGISAKTVQLLPYKGQLFAGTLHGVYQLEGDSAIELNRFPVLYMFGMPNKSLLLVSTSDEEVKVLGKRRGKWQETNLLEGLNDYIDQITIDPQQNVWLCGADSLYKLSLESSFLGDIEVFKIENPHFERVYATNYEGKIHFINSSGYYAYENSQIVKQEYLEAEIGLSKKYVLGTNGELWLNTGSKWYGANNDIKKTLNFLSLFKDPQSVAMDAADNFWVITASNDLYKINIASIESIRGEESMYLKEVRSNDEQLSLQQELEVDQESSSLSFEFASPDYAGIYRKEYQYRLSNASGTRSGWSNWSATNNIISYQFLPPGKYVLEARSRNSLGNTLSAAPFEFSIVPPYWKRPWFYVAELLFFGSLMAFTFYLNRGEGKFSFISRLLGFLTLILIVEFFQTVAEYKFETNESPVINFFIQAFIALLILPVEGVVRRWLTRKPEEKASKIQDSSSKRNT